MIDNPLDQNFNSRGCGFRKGARGGLHGISQHDDPCLFGLRLGTRITEILLIERIHFWVLFFLCFLVEVRDQTRSVMLLDDVSDPLTQMIFAGQLYPVLHMRDEDEA